MIGVLNVVEEGKLEIPQKYFDLLPEPIKYAENNNALIQIRNSLAWLFYLCDLPKRERDKIIQELLKSDYRTKLNLHPELDAIGIFLYFQTEYEKIISSIKRILKRISQYKITHPGLIITSLYSTWVQPYTLSEHEYKLLVEIVRNPRGSFREWSKNTKLSLAGVKYTFDRLKRKLFLRINCLINFNALKLKHVFVRISGIYNNRLKKMTMETFLENIWCRSVWWFASNPDTLFVSLTIPSHTRCVYNFLEYIKSFSDIGNVDVYEVREMFSSYNLSAYNPKTGWNFSPSAWTMFSFSQTSEDYLGYLKQISSIRRLAYTNLHNFKFSKGDLYIISGLFRDFRLKTTILSNISGYSLPTVSKKKREFVEKGILCPDTFVVNIGLSNSIALLWEKSSEEIEYLIYASAELPRIIGYKMEKIFPSPGTYLMLFTWLPGIVSWDFIQHFSELGREVGLREVYYEYKGPGSFSIDRFIHRWDGKRQVWKWKNGNFQII